MCRTLIGRLTLAGGVQFHHRFDHRTANNGCYTFPLIMFSFRWIWIAVHRLDFEFALFSFCRSAGAAVGRFFICLCLDFDCAAFIYFCVAEGGGK